MFRFLIIAILLCVGSGCAGRSLVSKDQLRRIAEASSCERPLIIQQRSMKQDSLDASDISPEERVWRVWSLGYRISGYNNVRGLSEEQCAGVEEAACDADGVYRYKITDSDTRSGESRLYVKHILADTDVEAADCQPTYTYGYRPPVKLGGSGRVTVFRHQC
ncbi:MAG: hypothetical protein GDA39_08975 [Hyphomonadaceae bacterium]|nr:hypothetical protein [Hyphomonadaceae bacterium]MBC6412978.1 hypothetical protein [Hyphomonadaceae bacterium]